MLPLTRRLAGITAPLCPSSEHTNVVAQTRENKEILRFVLTMTKCASADIGMYGPIHARYQKAAKAKKRLATSYETSAKVGNSSKMLKGRMVDLESTEDLGRLDHMFESLGVTTERIMKHVSEYEMSVLFEIVSLGPADDVNKCVDESHLCPEKHQGLIEGIMEKMERAGTVTEEISRFSQGLHVRDGLSSACLRSGDSLDAPASKFFHKDGVLQSVINPHPKNEASLKRSRLGMKATHEKGAECARDYVVSLVVLRPLMRRIVRLQAGGGAEDGARGGAVGKMSSYEL